MNIKTKKKIIAKKRAEQLLQYAIYNNKNNVRLSIIQANIVKIQCKIRFFKKNAILPQM